MTRLQHNDPQYVAQHFEPSRLTLAREYKSSTRADVAAMVGKTTSALSQIESGNIRPDSSTVAKLALALGVPVGFFASTPRVPKMELDACHFRSLRSASQYKRRQALAAAQMICEVMKVYEAEGVGFPAEQLSSFKQAISSTKLTPEEIANEFRAYFELGWGPLTNVIGMVEYFGVTVLPLDRNHREIDAFSTWSEGRPIMFLVTQDKPASRTHFDAAHELGHLIMHDQAQPGDATIEDEANRFASALLLPQRTFSKECPSYFTMSAFRKLKRRWHVSIAGCIFRAHQLGLITKNSQRNGFIKLSKAGWRKNEPDEWELQQPQALAIAIKRKAHTLSLKQLAASIPLHEPMLEDLLGGIQVDVA